MDCDAGGAQTGRVLRTLPVGGRRDLHAARIRQRLWAEHGHAQPGGDDDGVLDLRALIDLPLDRILQRARAARREDLAVLAALLDALEEAVVGGAAVAALRALVLDEHVSEPFGRLNPQRW